MKPILEKLSETLKYVGLSTTTPTKTKNCENIYLNVGHNINSILLLSAPKRTRERTDLKAVFIGKMKPNLHDKSELSASILFFLTLLRF